MGTHRLGEFIIDVASQRSGRIDIERIEAHGGEREHLKIDLRLVHVSNPAGAKVEKLGLQFRKLPGRSLAAGLGCPEKGFSNEVFFKRNRAHTGLDDAGARRVSSMLNENCVLDNDFDPTPFSVHRGNLQKQKRFASMKVWPAPDLL
jgi:hypothetical protein